jgi:hypothetical protein
MRTHLTHQPFSLVALIPLVVAITGCAVIETIFKAGVWVGVLAVAALAAVIVALVRMLAPR